MKATVDMNPYSPDGQRVSDGAPVGEDGKLGPPCCAWQCEVVRPLWKNGLIVTRICVSCDSVISLLDIYPKKVGAYVHPNWKRRQTAH